MTPTDGPDLASPLLAELGWLVRVRWVAGGLVLVGALASAAMFGWTAQHTGVLAVAGAVFLYNGLLALMLAYFDVLVP